MTSKNQLFSIQKEVYAKILGKETLMTSGKMYLEKNSEKMIKKKHVGLNRCVLLFGVGSKSSQFSHALFANLAAFPSFYLSVGW